MALPDKSFRIQCLVGMFSQPITFTIKSGFNFTSFKTARSQSPHPQDHLAAWYLDLQAESDPNRLQAPSYEAKVGRFNSLNGQRHLLFCIGENPGERFRTSGQCLARKEGCCSRAPKKTFPDTWTEQPCRAASASETAAAAANCT